MIAAIVPAAGKGTRMGGPKLTLPVAGRPLIARVVAALRDGGAARVAVVVGPPGSSGSAELVEAAAGAGAEVVVAAAGPPDMRASVQIGLDHLLADPASPLVAWLLAPGDSPGISPEAVARVIACGLASPPGSIVVPARRGRRGHPAYFPRESARAVRDLPEGRGINALIAAEPGRVVELDLGDLPVDADLDTPDDYRRWSGPDVARDS